MHTTTCPRLLTFNLPFNLHPLRVVTIITGEHGRAQDVAALDREFFDGPALLCFFVVCEQRVFIVIQLNNQIGRRESAAHINVFENTAVVALHTK